MFQQWDYGVKLTKEQEIRERIQHAETERLIRSIRPRRDRLSARLIHSVVNIMLSRSAQRKANMPSRASRARQRPWIVHPHSG